MNKNSSEKVLEVNNLSVTFGKKSNSTYAVKDISFKVFKGETLGVVGESGCGKSTSVLALMGLLGKTAHVSGTMILNGKTHNLSEMKYKEWRKIRGTELAMVFQDSLASLNPLKRIGEQVAEAIYVKKTMSKKEARQEAKVLLDLVEIPNVKDRFRQYPHEFSGGMRQRVMIAMALANKPNLLICDEPTTALDVTVQAQILHTIKRLQNDMDMSVILVTHDLGVIGAMADRTQVMYGGKIIESGPTQEIIQNAEHHYTNALIQAMPDMVDASDELYTIPGSPPQLTEIFDRCPFGPRCEAHTEECDIQMPPLVCTDSAESKNLHVDHLLACVHPVKNSVEVK